MTKHDSLSIEEMKQINQQQRDFYEKAGSSAPSKENSLTTNAYRRLRRRALGILEEVGIRDEVDRCHRRWCPDDLSDSKVLDLGAGAGTDFSIELAARAGMYIANDLSTRRLEELGERLEAHGVREYRLVETDFLESEFPEAGFDLVYAHSALHHFGGLQPFLELLLDRMQPGALLLSHDPIITWTPYRLFRRLYEPFQSDSPWEYPFTRSRLRTIHEMFRVEHVQGLIGRSKWAIPLALVSRSLGLSVAETGHQYDLNHATNIEDCLNCLQIAMCLSKDV